MGKDLDADYIERTPVKFCHNEKEYTGELQQVIGGDDNVWFLVINGKERGQLIYNDGWRFISDKGEFPEWALILGQQVRG